MVQIGEIWRAKNGGQRIVIMYDVRTSQGLRMWNYHIVGDDFMLMIDERSLLQYYELYEGDDSGSTGGTSQKPDSPRTVREVPKATSDAESEESEEMYDWREQEEAQNPAPNNNFPWRADPYWIVLFESIRATSVVYGRNQTEDEIKEIADNEYWMSSGASHRMSEFKDRDKFFGRDRFCYKVNLKF